MSLVPLNVACTESDVFPRLHQGGRNSGGQEGRDFFFRPRPMKSDGQVLGLAGPTGDLHSGLALWSLGASASPRIRLYSTEMGRGILTEE